MTGVSAIGNVIFDVPACCGSGETNPFRWSSWDLLGLPFLRFFSTGAVSPLSCLRVVRVVRGALAGCVSGSGKVGFAVALVCLVELSDDFFDATALSDFSTGRFLGGRPLLSDGLGAGASG